MLICAVASLVLDPRLRAVLGLVPRRDGGLSLTLLDRSRRGAVCRPRMYGARSRHLGARRGYPSLAAVTLWSSLGFRPLVGFQPCARLLAGARSMCSPSSAHPGADVYLRSRSRPAYLFGPECPDWRIVAAAWFPTSRSTRTGRRPRGSPGWRLGSSRSYLASRSESIDLAAAYRPVMMEARRDRSLADARSVPGPPGDRPDFCSPPSPREPPAVTRTTPGTVRGTPRATGNLRPMHRPGRSCSAPRPITRRA